MSGANTRNSDFRLSTVTHPPFRFFPSAHIIFDDGSTQRWFSMVWVKHDDGETPDAAFMDQWNTTLRASMDWEAPPHLNHTDFVFTAGDTARKHIVISKPFLQHTAFEELSGGGSGLGRPWRFVPEWLVNPKGANR